MSAMTTAAGALVQLAAPPPRRRRVNGRIATPAVSALVCVVVLLLAVDVALHLHTGATDLTSWWLGDAALAAALTVPGALVARNRPQNAIGWLLCGAAFSLAMAAAGREYLAFGFLGGAAPAYLWIGWITDSVYMASMMALPIVLMLFPDGRPMSRRAGRLLVLPLAAMALGVFGSLFYKQDVDVRGRTLHNPGNDLVPQPLADWAVNASNVLFFASIVAAIAVLTLRYRRATGEVRQQLKWVVWAGAIGVVELGSEMLPDNSIGMITGPVASTLLAASICIAILRHRMFDIDVVINRTLVFAVLTLIVVAGYIGLVTAFDSLAGRPVRLGPGVLATAVVALAFAPLRHVLQRGVDRLMYGDRKNPYGVMTQLGRRLESRGEQGSELSVVVDTVTQALKLPYAAIVGPDGALLAEAGRRAPAAHVEPLGYQGRSVGQLRVAARAGRTGFSRDELRLLADLARQVGAAVHAVRLSGDLQASRQRLVTAKEEERRRLRRDLHDGLGPKLAAVGLKIDAARTLADVDPQQSKAVLSTLSDDVRSTITDVRRLVYGLRPPALDELGLTGALREGLARFDGDGTVVSIDAAEDLPPLPAAVEVAAYRIVTEAVTNVIRHAAARRCEVRLECAEARLRLSVTDDGTGLPAAWRAGVGTASMAERAAELGGTLRLLARRGGSGTEVRAELPLARPGQAS